MRSRIVYSSRGREFFIDDEQVTEEEWQDSCVGLETFQNATAANVVPSGYPYYSRALGCRPSEIPRLTRQFAEHGVRVEYDKQGRMRIDSKRHRNKVAKGFNLRDWSGGFNDP